MNDQIQRNLLRESCKWKAWVNYFYRLRLRQECRSEEEDYIQQTCKNFSIGRKYRKLVEQVDLILWSQVQTLIQERESDQTIDAIQCSRFTALEAIIVQDCEFLPSMTI